MAFPCVSSEWDRKTSPYICYCRIGQLQFLVIGPADQKCCTGGSMGTSRTDHIHPVLASLDRFPVKSRTESKIALLTYKSLNDRSSLYLRDLIAWYFSHRLWAYLWFKEFPKVEWELVPSVMGPLSCEIAAFGLISINHECNGLSKGVFLSFFSFYY